MFRQILNFSPLGHLREKDGAECFAPFVFELLHAEMFQKCGPRPQEKPEIEENPNLGTPPKNKFLTLEGSALLSSLTFDTRTLKHVIMREKPKCSSQGYLSKVRLKAQKKLSISYVSSNPEFQPFGPPEKEGRRRVLCTICFCAAARRNASKMAAKTAGEARNSRKS